MVADVVHGALYRFRDPTRISLARYGKDRLCVSKTLSELMP
jgi:hypothetical protein